MGRGDGNCLRDAEQSQVHAKFISGESAGSKTRLNAKIFAKCHCQCPAPHRPALPHSRIPLFHSCPHPPHCSLCNHHLFVAPRRGRSCPRRKLNYSPNCIWAIHLHTQCSAKVCVHTHSAHSFLSPSLSLFLSLPVSALRFLRDASPPLFWLMQIVLQPEAKCDADFTQRGAN